VIIIMLMLDIAIIIIFSLILIVFIISSIQIVWLVSNVSSTQTGHFVMAAQGEKPCQEVEDSERDTMLTF